MKSKINKLADYREAPFERNVTIPYSEEHVQAQMRHLTRGYKKTEAVERLAKGDVAVLSLSSELEKFNKPSVFVTVGGVGESFAGTAEGKTVQVTVKQGSRTVFPEPTDEMAAAYGEAHEEFAGVKTVAEYREKVVEKYYQEKKQEAFFDVMEGIMQYVMTHSDFSFDEGEVTALLEEMRAEITGRLDLKEGQTLKDLTSGQMSALGVKSYEELEKLMRNQAEYSIADSLWTARMNNVESADEIQGYPYEFLDTYVRENLNLTTEDR